VNNLPILPDDMTRLISLLLCACVAATAAHAQEIAFQGISWRTPADSVRARVEALGFTFGGPAREGATLYEAPDGTRLYAYTAGGRLIGFIRVDPGQGVQIPVRYRALADSLEAARGKPDEVNEESERVPSREWVYGLASVVVEARRIGAGDYVRVAWRGPGWFDEAARTEELPPLPAGFTAVNLTQFMRTAVDTTLHPRRGAATVRGRFRLEYRAAIVPTTSDGSREEPMDVAEYEMEFDCAVGRARIISRATFLEGRPVASYRPQSQQPWTTPQPDGHYDRGMKAVCRAARGR
jgi:hypothetical protein